MANFLDRLTMKKEQNKKDNNRYSSLLANDYTSGTSLLQQRGLGQEGTQLQEDDIYGDSLQSPSSVEDEWSNNREWNDMGLLGKTFDILQRGQYASANVAEALMQGDSDYVQSAWDGLTGEEKASYVEILQRQDVPWAPVLGTVLDIGLDPFTYMSGPAQLIKGTKAGKGLSSAVDDAVKLAKGKIPGGKKVGTVVDWLGHAFDPDYKIPDEVSTKFWMENYGLSSDKKYALQDIRTALDGITDRQKKVVTDWIQKGTRPTDPDDIKVFNQAMDIMDDVTKKAIQYRHVSAQKVKDMMVDGRNTYLPSVLQGHLDSWVKGGDDLFKKAKIPNYAMNRTTDMNIQDWKHLSDDLIDLSKSDTVADMKQKAMSKLESDSRWFTDKTMETVTDIINGSDDISNAKKKLHQIGMDYQPIEEIDKILAISKSQQSQALHQDNVLEFVLRQSDDADNWRKVLSESDSVVPDGYETVIRKNEVLNALDDIEATNGQLSELQNTIKHNINKYGEDSFFDLSRISDDIKRDIMLDDELSSKVDVFGLDEEIYNYLNRGERFYGGTKDKNAFLKLYDKGLRKWKKMATIFRFPFHARNAITNQVRMMQGGMNIPDLAKYGTKAAKIQKGGDDIIDIGGVKKSADEWLRAFSAKGVRGWGFVGEMDPSDFAKGAPSSVSRREKYIDIGKRIVSGEAEASDLKELTGVPTDVGGWLGHVIEDNARISMATWKTEQALKGADNVTDDLASAVFGATQEAVEEGTGASLKEAFEEGAQESWKHLFQYDQLTDFEQSTMKRLMPFYTWMRKNLQLQAEKVLTDPVGTKKAYQMYSNLQYANPDTNEEKRYKPDYMENLGYFKIPDELREAWEASPIAGGNTSSKDPIYANIDMPWNDVQNLFNNQSRTFLSSLTPATLPIKVLTNTQTFPIVGQDIEEFEGDMVPAPSPLTLLPTSFWKPLGFKPIKDKDTGKTILGAPAKAVKTMYDTLPMLREMDSMFPQKGTVDLEEPEAPWQRLKYLTGIQFRPVDVAQQKKYRQIERDQNLSAVGKKMSELGRPLTDEELDRYLED